MGKSIYDYNDFLTTQIGIAKYQNIEIPIGQKCENKNMKYHYTINPYNVNRV